MSGDRNGCFSGGGVACFYCGERAALLCDGVLGWHRVWSGEDARYVADVDGAGIVTCDRPLCEAHAARRTPQFFDWTDKAGRQRGEMDTEDLCADCLRVAGRPMALLDPESAAALPRRQLLRST